MWKLRSSLFDPGSDIFQQFFVIFLLKELADSVSELHIWGADSKKTKQEVDAGFVTLKRVTDGNKINVGKFLYLNIGWVTLRWVFWSSILASYSTSEM